MAIDERGRCEMLHEDFAEQDPAVPRNRVVREILTKALVFFPCPETEHHRD